MALINCPECGKEISDKAESCPNCGYRLIEENRNNSVLAEKCRTKKNRLLLLAVFFFCVSGFFFYRCYDVKNNYYNSDYSSLVQNAYVGGDAYNFIINGTYFAGYAVIASASAVCGIILSSSGAIINSKIKEYE